MNNELAVFGELVPVTDNKFCVDARQLHKALEVGRMFAHWIKERIEKYNFTEGVDYQKSSIISGLPILASSKRRSIPQPRIDYKLTLDMAKQLAMVENNERGLLARQYFIECERKLKKQKPELTMENLCREYIATCEKQRRLEKTLQQAIAEKQEAIKTLEQKTNEIGAGPDYYAMHDIPWYNEMFPRKGPHLNQHLGRILSNVTNDMGLEVQKCHEEKGAHWWRSYPRQAVDRVYKMLMADKSILRKHRKICRMTPKPVIQ